MKLGEKKTREAKVTLEGLVTPLRWGGAFWHQEVYKLPVFRMQFERILNCQKFEKKHIHLDILCVHKIVSQKTDFFCVVRNKTKFVQTKAFHESFFFCFLSTYGKKTSVFAKLIVRT